MANTADPLSRADRAITAGDPRAAIRALRNHEDLDVVAVASILHCTAGMFEDRLMERAAAAVISDPSPQHLSDLGEALLGIGLPDVAIDPLRASLDAREDVDTTVRLAAALQETGMAGRALAVLEQRPQLLEAEWFARYLAAFNAVMAGRLDTAREHVARLSPPTGDDGGTFMQERIRLMLARADIVARHSPLDADDLRGWEAVISGCTVATLSPYGFIGNMRGRWAMVGVSAGQIRLGIDRLQAVLARLDRMPISVRLLPDRDSQVLGHAVARILGVAATRWSTGDPSGLVVAFDLDGVDGDIVAALRPNRPGQVLYTRTVKWTDPPHIAPDVTAILAQHPQVFWGEQIGVDPETKRSVRHPADGAPAEAIAERIVAAEGVEDEGDGGAPPDGVAVLLGFVDACRDALGVAMDRGVRERMWFGGPVSSSRFL